MNCLKCKKFDKEKQYCKKTIVEHLDLECHLKLLYIGLSHINSSNAKLVFIFAEILEIQKGEAKRLKEFIDKANKWRDEGDTWKGDENK